MINQGFLPKKKELKTEQQQLSRKQKGSNNRNKAKKESC
ncbi:IS891/IS1136/IS1341 transposase [Crocosphaera watsonii WH 0401]|uniref:IS891/IS1136/IS1341 transposase n=1 Tax=Crocosphaera watsonii WH 0401 TaxID=555881 RepID=T2J3E8_CROWT|nr:IS891/IS1136/IS1341 transposase [Crocosphaera watsonii WH 0401]